MSLKRAGYQRHEFKIVLLGDGCAGKTSMALRFVENKFNETHQSTLQASFLKKIITVNGARVTLNIWDTAGQEQFHALGPIYYRGAHGALLVYDVTDPDSLNKVKSWVKELKKMLGASVCIMIVGNKIDLLPPDEQIACKSNPLIAEAINYANTINSDHFVTSAKLDRGIEETFLELTSNMIAKKELSSSTSASRSLHLSSNSASSRTLRLQDEPDPRSPEGRNNSNNNAKCAC